MKKSLQVDRFRVRPGDRSALTRHAPDFTGHLKDKDEPLGSYIGKALKNSFCLRS